ncbi:unnamed protein product, partial [Heterotrigona itama]
GVHTTPFYLLFGTHIELRENLKIRRSIDDEWITMFQEKTPEDSNWSKRKDP